MLHVIDKMVSNLPSKSKSSLKTHIIRIVELNGVLWDFVGCLMRHKQNVLGAKLGPYPIKHNPINSILWATEQYVAGQSNSVAEAK